MNASKTITITITAADAVAIRNALLDYSLTYERKAMAFGPDIYGEIASDIKRLAYRIEEKRSTLD